MAHGKNVSKEEDEQQIYEYKTSTIIMNTAGDYFIDIRTDVNDVNSAIKAIRAILDYIIDHSI